MLAYVDIATVASVNKNFVTDQAFTHFASALTATSGFNATEGYGSATGDSKILASLFGGFNNQRITAIMKYVSPTAVNSENFGPIVRGKNLLTNTVRQYYQARVQAQTARITKVIGNGASDVHTNLGSGVAFALPQDTLVTIMLEVIGSTLTATFTATGLGTVTVGPVTDTDIPANGVMGFRSLTSTMWCREALLEQLQEAA
jgi:hypothetical protein